VDHTLRADALAFAVETVVEDLLLGMVTAGLLGGDAAGEVVGRCAADLRVVGVVSADRLTLVSFLFGLLLELT
jgi:hypothetical protein